MHFVEELMIHVYCLCEVKMKWFKMICFVDLPNLKSITSVESSFYGPGVVILKSSYNYGALTVFRHSKSSKS